MLYPRSPPATVQVTMRTFKAGAYKITAECRGGVDEARVQAA